MLLIPLSTASAALVLADRAEKRGTFLSFVDNPQKKYPVIAFYRPPEFCGINEPTDATAYSKLQQELRTELFDSIQCVCTQNNINALYCTGIDINQAEPYVQELSRRKIQLFDIGTAQIPLGIKLIQV